MDVTQGIAEGVGSGGDTPSFRLKPPIPNPAAVHTEVRYHIDDAAATTLTLYDALGREVQTLASGIHAAGPHYRAFDMTGLPGVLYFLLLRAGHRGYTRPFTAFR